MREIKFRGISLTKHDWVYGNYEWYHKPEKHIISCPYTSTTYGIDKNTLGQYTGFKDRNGKEIYEGDVLNSLYRNDGCKGVYVVVFDYGGFYPKKYKKHQQNGVLINMYDLQRCEVIGNIYENPELLEVI